MAGPKLTKRDQQRIETRNRIYETAMRLFTRKGFTQVSVNDICEKAGVSKGTFYYYFKSKDQVYLEEYLKIDEFMAAEMKGLEKKLRSPTKRLVAFTLSGFEYIDKLGVKLIKVIWSGEIDPETKKPAMISPKRPIPSMIEQMIREGQERGELRKDVSAETMAQLYVRCYRGIIYEWCLHNGKFDLVAACGEFTRLVIEGFKKQ